MKTIVTIAAAAGLIALGACSQSATENKADAIEANAENTADVIEVERLERRRRHHQQRRERGRSDPQRRRQCRRRGPQQSRPLSSADTAFTRAPRGAPSSWCRRRDSAAAMKRALPVLAASALLSACAVPEARLRAGLVNAGLPPPLAACMAERMVDRLSLMQLRRLGDLPRARAGGVGGGVPPSGARAGRSEVLAASASSAAFCEARRLVG